MSCGRGKEEEEEPTEKQQSDAFEITKKKMVRAPCCEKMGLKKGPWTAEEDQILISYINEHGHSNWRALPKLAGEFLQDFDSGWNQVKLKNLVH